MTPKLHKGYYYWPTFEAARLNAAAYPGSRVVHYELGWAVQRRISGPYLGPNGFA